MGVYSRMPSAGQYKEIFRLAEMLDENGIEYEMHPLHDGYQICVPANHAERDFDGDAIQHQFSYGSDFDKVEVWGFGLPAPEGWLSSGEALSYFVRWKEDNAGGSTAEPD